jgi:hypothetical protein
MRSFSSVRSVAASLVALLLAGIIAGCSRQEAAPPAAATPAPAAVPAVPPPNPERNAYFGDLHLHSGYSADAFALGTRLTPEDAFNWARGKPLEYGGRTIQRKAPLDFLALTDHAEYLGVIPEAADPNGLYAGSEWTRALNDPDPAARFALFRKLVGLADANVRLPEFEKPELLRSLWQRYAAEADRQNEPGTFTAFVAFEWTSAPGNQNLHRCVIFRGKGPEMPFTSLDSQDPEALWTYLEAQRRAGLQVVAIPHNGNISNGLMFDAAKTYAGAPITRAYAERRMANEPLFEIVQEKGSSDTHPTLSPDDEFAAFEIYPFLLGQKGVAKFARGSYLRQAYGVGQEIAEQIGVNPFKYGIEAGTDNHAGMSSTEEFNFQGPNGNSIDRRAAIQQVTEGTPVYNSPGGLTGIWAEQNTRESLYDALVRRETFGTSGGRIRVRLFASFDYPADLTTRDAWVREAYATGVPMGGDLPGTAGGRKPTFAIHAVKDPDSGNLDRVQMIKVSTKRGRSSEHVIDVLWSGDRAVDRRTGKLPAVGSTLDLANATYTNDIGAIELHGTWTDDAFDPEAQATYYVRVLEIPTPRWTTHWSVETGQPLNPKVPAMLQERAWSSPIWYVPVAQVRQ